ELGKPSPMHHAKLGRHDADRVAVWRRCRDGRMTNSTAIAREIDDIDWLPELLLQQAGDDAAGRIGAAARGPWDDEGDGPFRIFGAQRCRRKGKCGRYEGRQTA